MSMRRLLLPALIVLLAAGVSLAEEESPCAMCHDQVAADMTHQIHMRIQPFEVQGRAVGCEGCHGSGEAHMEEGDPALIRTFTEGNEDDDAVCLSCHATKHHPEWEASTHAMEDVSCFECHTIHTESDPLDSCGSCHADTEAQFNLPSRHPLREGKMSCVSCHDPHMATEAQLKTHQRVNDLCFTCHLDKEGPFIFEHEPVVEDCRLCHTPHGAVANNLLTANEPMLCLQCHEFHFHAGLLSPEHPEEIGGTLRQNPYGEHGMNRAFSTKCTQCHPRIHGSDSPSQTVAGLGRGMTR